MGIGMVGRAHYSTHYSQTIFFYSTFNGKVILVHIIDVILFVSILGVAYFPTKLIVNSHY